MTDTTQVFRTITVTRAGNSTNIHLHDSEGHDADNDITTLVDPSNIVKWEPGEGVTITGISRTNKAGPGNPRNPNDVAVLTADPSPNGDGTWQGTVVSTSPGAGKWETYNIVYDLAGVEGGPFTDDPKLQMNT